MGFQIRYGLGGGFGGAGEWEDVNARSLRDAESFAYDAACQEYESYEGLHGLRSVSDIMEEDEVSEVEAEEYYIGERDSWIEYQAREI